MKRLYPEKDNFQKPCACGCGELIWDRNRNGPLLFKAHHSKHGLWWFEGKPHTTLGKKRPDASLRMTLHNPNKRVDVGIAGIHNRIKQRLPKPALCQACNKAPVYDLANVSDRYLEDLSDWQWLCRKCHMMIDGRMTNLIQYRKHLVDVTNA